VGAMALALQFASALLVQAGGGRVAARGAVSG
jgi:hypothetical protein